MRPSTAPPPLEALPSVLASGAHAETAASRGPRLVIQIPCFNEAETLPAVLTSLPQAIPGVGDVRVLIIDDGSTDDTVAVAQAHGVHHIVRHPTNRGLAAAYQSGLDAALRLGADLIVNTDGDNQYPAAQIPALIAPILAQSADVVIGDRQTHSIAHFSPLKRFLQRFGSWVVELAAGVPVPDATSGFRALTREAALRQIVLTRYSYTLETIIQATKKGLRVAYVPIEVNEPLRESRLIKSTWNYVRRQAMTILRSYLFYEPLRAFLLLASPLVVAGAFLLARFLYFYFTSQSGIGRHVQSVVIGGTLLTVGFLIVVLGVMAEINATNRTLLEELLYRQRKQEADQAAAAHARAEPESR